MQQKPILVLLSDLHPWPALRVEVSVCLSQISSIGSAEIVSDNLIFDTKTETNDDATFTTTLYRIINEDGRSLQNSFSNNAKRQSERLLSLTFSPSPSEKTENTEIAPQLLLLHSAQLYTPKEPSGIEIISEWDAFITINHQQVQELQEIAKQAMRENLKRHGQLTSP